MRRFAAFALLALFMLQSSGAAMATTAANTLSPPLRVQAQLGFTQVLQSLENTRIGAFLLGRESRYAAMHAPPPKRLPPASTLAQVRAQVRDDRNEPRMIRQGILVRPSHAIDLRGFPPPGGRSRLRLSIALPIRTPRRSMRVPNMRAFSTMAATTVTNGSGTIGINRWWTYDQGAIPGVGTWMANVANGNLLIQADDLDVKERGIDLAFRRTYNSQSQHDHLNTDGSGVSVFGDGWTNPVDARIAFYNNGQTASIYDIDGARYDYTLSSNGTWTPPPGMEGTQLVMYDNNYVFAWWKKNGDVYEFNGPSYASTQPAIVGRLWMIYARNNYNTIMFNYYFVNGDASNIENLTQIQVKHSDGHYLTLNFSPLTQSSTNNTYTELTSVQLPDQKTTVSYTYYPSAPWQLEEVDHPSNGSNNNSTIPEYYTWSGNLINTAESPRYVESYRATGGNPVDGNYTSFTYSGNAVQEVANYGIVNWCVPDNAAGPATCSQLQSTSNGTSFSKPNWQETFTYSPTTPCNSGTMPAPCTTATDSDHHRTVWSYDSIGRETKRGEFTGESNPTYLLTSQQWNSNNNIIASVDARENETDYFYDGNDNMIAIEQPQVSASVNGSLQKIRPLHLFSYDTYNNQTSYCDPNYDAAHGLSWAVGSAPPTCPTTPGTAAAPGPTVYKYDRSDSYEPYGRLSDVYTPVGYHRSISYNSSAQGGDYGLPTDVNGDCIAELDGTNRCPHQGFAYDGHGNMTYFGGGVGNWSLSYDALDRLLTATDPDSVVSYTCYYPDGETQYTETAAQHASDGSPSSCQLTPPAHAVAYTYDADGNTVTEVHHYGNVAGTTTKWYDGEDRLVEVQLPHDATHDLYSYAWMTRYFFDLSQGNTVSVDGSTFTNYGNVYKVQSYIPSLPVTAPNAAPATPAWTDVRGWQYDAADRLVAKFEDAVSTLPEVSYQWDGGSTSTAGLLVSKSYGGWSNNARTANFQYDATGLITADSYTNDGGITPSKQFTYDPNGQPTALYSSQFGTEQRSYDGDGNILTDIEPNTYQAPGTTTNSYYPDDLQKTLAASSIALPAGTSVSYSYRTDGLLETAAQSWTNGGNFTFTYSNAGRLQNETDPATGKTISYTNSSNQTYSQTLQARQTTYDGYGRVSKMVLPEGYLYSAFSYDDEGETTGYTTSNGLCKTLSQTYYTCSDNVVQGFGYNVRGELVTQGSVDGTKSSSSSTLSADGFLCTKAGSGCTQGWDARTDMIVNVPGTDPDTGAANAFAYGYDAAGENASIVNGGTLTRRFDGDQHLIAQENDSASLFNCDSGFAFGCTETALAADGTAEMDVEPGEGASFAWGTAGHPVEMTNTYVSASSPPTTSSLTYWAHWNTTTNDLLFESGPGLTNTDLALGTLGVSNATNGVEVEDRDPFGIIAATHDAYRFTAFAGYAPKTSYDKFGTPLVSDTGLSDSGTDPQFAKRMYFGHDRPDEYDTAAYGLAFQGVRAVDENIGQWVSPDQFGGYSDNPMSQVPYLWNNNNGLAYQDPSGYCSVNVTLPNGSITYDLGPCGYSGMWMPNLPTFMAPTDYALQNLVEINAAAQAISVAFRRVACGAKAIINAKQINVLGHSWPVTQVALQAALSTGGGIAGTAAGHFIALRGIPAAGAGLGGLVPMADATGFSEAVGAMAGTVVGRTVDKPLSGLFGVGGAQIGSMAADLSWDTLRSLARQCKS